MAVGNEFAENTRSLDQPNTVLTTSKALQAWIIACRPLHKGISALYMRLYTLVPPPGRLPTDRQRRGAIDAAALGPFKK